jgi:anti-anti-sigma factor
VLLDAPVPSSGLRLRIARPHHDAIVLSVIGDVDAATVTRFEEILLPRLSAAVGLVVVDLSAVDFLGVRGLELLHYAHLRANSRGLSLRVVVATHAVAHALRRVGLDTVLNCRPCVDSALTEYQPH